MSEEKCSMPPEGWYCTRPVGHSGPCAAWPISKKVGFQLMDDLAHDSDWRGAALFLALSFLEDIAKSSDDHTSIEHANRAISQVEKYIGFRNGV